jgi:quinol monooxygenase YgiN
MLDDDATRLNSEASMLHVLAFITTKPGMRDAVLQEFRSNMPAVRAQEGCIEYVPVIGVPTFGPFRAKLGLDTFVAVEKWASTEALNAHAASAHMKAYTAPGRPI